MPIPGSHSHGPWTLTKPDGDWTATWVATHRDTGETVETGEHHVERAKETLPMPDPADRPGYTTTGTVTIQPRRTTASPRGWDVA